MRGYGIDAEATRQATRGVTRNYEPIWRTKAREANRLRSDRPRAKTDATALASRQSAAVSWRHIASALAVSPRPGDRDLAAAIDSHVSQIERRFDRDTNVKVDRDARR